MLIKVLLPTLLFISAFSHAENKSNSETCDSIATFAASANQAKSNGVDFITFVKKLDEVDAPDETKVSMKFIAAKAYLSVTPEEAYSSTYMECIMSLGK